MSEKRITILTVNYNTSDFIKLMLYALKKLTKNSYKVIICENGSSLRDISRLKNIVEKYDNVEVIYRQQSSRGSIGHAEAMNLLTAMVRSEYFVTMDSDATFLCKDWDELLISKIDAKIKAVGTTLPPTQKNLKPNDFPFVFSVLYETDTFKRLNPSFMPASTDSSKDTGWEIREKYIANDYSGHVFDAVNTKFTKTTLFGSLYCAVYFMDELLICSHFGRGSSGGVAKYSDKWFFKIPKISKYVRRSIGFLEKRKWIRICNSAIESQCLV